MSSHKCYFSTWWWNWSENEHHGYGSEGSVAGRVGFDPYVTEDDCIIWESRKWKCTETDRGTTIEQMDPESNLIVEIKDDASGDIPSSPLPPSNPVSHLGVLFIATAGQNGPNLGCDEEEIVLLVLSILKVSTNEVVETKSFVVQPHTSDINENLLSEECKVDFKLSEDQVKNAKILDEVIEQIDEFIRIFVGRDDVFVLVADGQLPLRQCLHPETSAKEINLPEYYNSFFDLRKEFFAGCHYVPESIDEMLKHLTLEVPECPTLDGTKGKANEMTAIVQHLLSIGHTFDKPEKIHMRLEPGLCSKNEEVDGQTVVRARGLPWQSSDADIAKFFRGLNIAKGGVALCLSPQGRRNGEALIRFENQEHRDMALRRHKHHIGARYIEVYKATGEDFIAVAGGSNNEAQAFLIKGGQVIIRMRGLPYDCTAKQVLDFFNSGDNACHVLDNEEGVLFVRRTDGRATGDAFVLFAEESDAGKALSKHRESIGSRYIELFRSTTAEVQQVLNRCLEATKSAEVSPQLPLAAPAGQSGSSVVQVPPVTVSIMPQHIITAGTRKDCIRLRGLPYEAQVQNILDFLGEHAKNIVYQGVHMVYNAQGQPSGEAFIQMDSEHSAFLAAQAKHHRYMVYFKKQRYIEVFQCSGEDMNLVLTGGIPLSPQKALVSPGMLSPPPEVGGASLLPVGSHSLSPPLQRQMIRTPGSMPLSAAAIAASMRCLAYAQSQAYLPHLSQQGLLGTSPGASALPHGLIGPHPYFQSPPQLPHNLIRIPHLSPPLQEDLSNPLTRLSLINSHPQLMLPTPQQLLLSSFIAQGGGNAQLSQLIVGNNCGNLPVQNVQGKRSYEEAFSGYESGGVLSAKRWQQTPNIPSNIYPAQPFTYKKE